MAALACLQRLSRPAACSRRSQRSSLVVRASKGFGSDVKAPQKPKEEEEERTAAEASTSAAGSLSDNDSYALEALEARIKSRRKKAVEAKVKVNAPAVDVATGKAPAPEGSAAEGVYLLVLAYYGIALLLGGLALAGSGFLPEAADAWIQDSVYPNYSWWTVGFLAMSSLYGLFKTGKLPGQKQQ